MKLKLNLRLKPFFLLAAAALLTLLGGCMAVDESKLYFDNPLGSDYLPVVVRQINLWPSRVLILPITGDVSDQARSEFELQFWAELKNRLTWVLLQYPGANSLNPSLALTEDQAIGMAQHLGADSILFINLSGERIYSPLRMVADVTIQDVASRQAVYKTTADYDVGNTQVANSARRYYIKKIQPRDAPDRSLSILSDLDEFERFTGYYSAKLIADSFIVPANTVTKGQKVEAAPETAPPPAPDQQQFQPNPQQNATDK